MIDFVLRLFTRLLLLALGLVAAASLAVVALLVACFWLGRNAWARLTGRPVVPFGVRMSPGWVFRHMRAQPGPAAQEASRTPRADATRTAAPRPHLAGGAEVIDVEPRAPRP